RVWKHQHEKYGDVIYEWQGTDLPMSQLPLDMVRKVVAQYEGLIANHLRPGSRARETDWGINTEYLKGTDAITFLLPEFQASRGLGRAVTLSTRLAIAERKYERAIDLMRINYRLGRDVGKEPILV